MKSIWTPLLITSAAFMSSVSYYWFVRRKRNWNIPEQWKKIGKIDKIIMYPLKSAAPRELEKAICIETGLMELDNADKFTFYDRCFILYDDQKMVKMKLLAHKHAVRISVESVDRDTVIFSAPNMSSLQLKVSEILSAARKVFILCSGSTIEAIDCGDKISQWMSQYLLDSTEGFRLAYYVEKVCRRRGAIEILRNDCPKLLSVYSPRENDSGALADVASYMVVSKETVEDVNSQLPEVDQFKAENLRPNIVVSGCDKYAEDNWDWIKIGDEVVMKRFKPCTRKIPLFKVNTDQINNNQSSTFGKLFEFPDSYLKTKNVLLEVSSTEILLYPLAGKPSESGQYFCQDLCLMVTINPDTGEANKNHQPFKLLKTYRTVKQLTGYDVEANSPVLGAYMGLYVPGNIKLGDPIFVNN